MMIKKMNKKGFLKGDSSNTIQNVILAFIGIVVLFKLVAALLPSLFSAGDSIQQSGIPFGDFFKTGGLIWLVLAAALLIYVISRFMGHGGKKGGY